MDGEQGNNRHFLSTFRLGSSFPAKANKRVVFPEPGGPNSNVILQKENIHKILSMDLQDILNLMIENLI